MRRLARLLALPAFALACSSPTAPDANGEWGSSQLGVTITRAGGNVNAPCGYGVIDSTWTLTSAGEFSGTGTYTFGGGPVPITGWPRQTARYAGRISGRSFTLAITLTESSTTLGPFRLKRGANMDGPVCLAANG